MLNTFQIYNIPITWTLIYIGWIGPGNNPRQLTFEEIINYTFSKIEQSAASNPRLIELAGLLSNQEHEVLNILRSLSLDEKIDFNNEVMKWVVIMLGELIKSMKIKKNYIDNLIEISEFWISFSCIPNRPPGIQAIDSDISPEGFYTKENYFKILSQNEIWLKKELGF